MAVEREAAKKVPDMQEPLDAIAEEERMVESTSGNEIRTPALAPGSLTSQRTKGVEDRKSVFFYIW